MTEKKQLELLIRQWRTITFKNNICFFGGTFNPWHDGHSACLELAKKYYNSLNLETDIVIIPDNNPWKNSEFTDKEKLKLYTNIKSKSKNNLVNPEFLLNNHSNPTYPWLKKFQEHYKGTTDLLIGFDNFVLFHKWEKYQELLNRIGRLLVVSRLDQEVQKKEQLNHIRSFNLKTEIHFLGNHDYEDLSSTELRNNLS